MRTGAVGGDYAGLGNRRGSIEERLDLGSVRLVGSVECGRCGSSRCSRREVDVEGLEWIGDVASWWEAHWLSSLMTAASSSGGERVVEIEFEEVAVRECSRLSPLSSSTSSTAMSYESLLVASPPARRGSFFAEAMPYVPSRTFI